MIARLYAALLRLYPRDFQAEFGEEMQAIFEDVMAIPPGQGLKISYFCRELRDLPGSLFEAYAVQWLRGGNMFMNGEYISPSSRWQAFLGILPFLAFGIASLLVESNQDFNFRSTTIYLAFYMLSLAGLLIGWIRGFPLWSYSYIGWSLVFAWWWTDMRTYGFDWGYRIWIPFGITILFALIWTRSLSPSKKFLDDIWCDWSRLMLAMFALETWVLMIYDENHHPYLLVFILASALIASGGVWFFLRSSTLWGRILSLLCSFICTTIVGGIAWTTWSWHEYYGFPKPEHWYDSWGISIIGVIFWFVILFWPALIGLIRKIVNRRIA